MRAKPDDFETNDGFFTSNGAAIAVTLFTFESNLVKSLNAGFELLVVLSLSDQTFGVSPIPIVLILSKDSLNGTIVYKPAEIARSRMGRSDELAGRGGPLDTSDCLGGLLAVGG